MKRRNRALAGMIVALFFIIAPAFGAVGEPPSSLLLDSISNLFGGVDFDHEMHMDLADDCSVCHHHGFGTGVEAEECARCHSDSQGTSSVACRDCHSEEPFTAEHIREMEADPNRFPPAMPELPC